MGWRVLVGREGLEMLNLKCLLYSVGDTKYSFTRYESRL